MLAKLGSILAGSKRRKGDELTSNGLGLCENLPLPLLQPFAALGLNPIKLAYPSSAEWPVKSCLIDYTISIPCSSPETGSTVMQDSLFLLKQWL